MVRMRLSSRREVEDSAASMEAVAEAARQPGEQAFSRGDVLERCYGGRRGSNSCRKGNSAAVHVEVIERRGCVDVTTALFSSALRLVVGPTPPLHAHLPASHLTHNTHTHATRCHTGTAPLQRAEPSRIRPLHGPAEVCRRCRSCSAAPACVPLAAKTLDNHKATDCETRDYLALIGGVMFQYVTTLAQFASNCWRRLRCLRHPTMRDKSVQYSEEDGESASDHLTLARPPLCNLLTASWAGSGTPSLLFLLFSHACTALLTLLVAAAAGLHPNLHFAPIRDAGAPHCLSTVFPAGSSPTSSTTFLIPPQPATPPLDLCNPSVPYPVPVPPSVTQLCTKARPLKYPLQRPKRYQRQDVAMSLLTVDAYKFDRDEVCLDTWMTQMRTPRAYFGVGIPRPAELLQPTLLIPYTNDRYISNLNKTFIALRELYHLHPTAAWFMQTSDDAYIDVDALLLRLEPLDSEQVLYVGGALGGQPCWLTGREVEYVGGGLGFLVSRGFMKRWSEDIEGWITTEWVTERGMQERSFQWGDVMVGCFMQQKGIPVTHILGGHPEIPDDSQNGATEFPHDDERWWGYHHIEPQRMLDIHALFTLQRIDQLQAHKQLGDMALAMREMAIEQWQSSRRHLARLDTFISQPALLTAPTALVEAPK